MNQLVKLQISIFVIQQSFSPKLKQLKNRNILINFVLIIIMIKNLVSITKLALLINRTKYPFSEKADILKTYLEIIPPHKIYQIRQKHQYRLDHALINLEKTAQTLDLKAVSKEDIKTLTHEVKKRVNFIPLPVLSRIAEIACIYEESQHGVELKKAYSKIIRTVKNGAQKLSVEEMVDLVYKLVKLGKKQYDLMKQVQKVIIQDRIKIDFPLIRKILYSYTHLNQGSSVLYSHISKTLTIGQHQFRPVQLAQAAYMLSKVSQNAKGGYGVFAIAQKHVQAVLPRMSFSQLVKVSSFLLTQDLGSNAFQLKLQQALYSTYPSKDKVKLTDFVALLKATSGYFFKFKQNALLSMLKTTTIRMTNYATLEQFQDILWSWGRLGKGDKEVWECLQSELMRRLQMLKPRQIAFAYYAVCSSNLTSTETLKAIQNKFVQLPLKQINEHYLIKFLLGMQKKKLYENEKFAYISEIVSQKIEKLSNNEFLSFLKIMNESDIDYESRSKVQGVVNSIKTVAKKLETRLYTLRLTQITQLLFLMVKLNIDDPNLIEKCFSNLDNVINIPKSAFIKALFCFNIHEKYAKCLQFVPIADELTKYGPIGYFFSPYEFPLFAYCLYNLAVNGKNVQINRTLLMQTQEALKQINPAILNDFVRKGYKQAFRLIQVYHNQPEQN